jgi:hypothetical protein
MRLSEICRWIISGRGVQDADGTRRNRPEIISPLKARSLANSRLVRFFGIDNAFTTADPQYKDWFVKEASSTLTFGVHGWHRIASVTCTLVDREVKRAEAEISLMQFVQTTTLAVMLETLFKDRAPVNATNFDHDTLLTAADCINNLWDKSKHHGEPLPAICDDLKATLEELIPGCSFEPKVNP